METNILKKIEGLSYDVLKKLVADLEIKTDNLKKATIIPAITEFFEKNPKKYETLFGEQQTKNNEQNKERSDNKEQETTKKEQKTTNKEQQTKDNSELERFAVLHVKDPLNLDWKKVMQAVNHYDQKSYFALMRKGESLITRKMAQTILKAKLK